MKKIKKIKKYEFVVILDELLYEKQGELRTEATFYKGRWISYMQFLNSGRWEMEGNYYALVGAFELNNLKDMDIYAKIQEQDYRIIFDRYGSELTIQEIISKCNNA